MSEWSPPVEGYRWLRARQPGGTFYIYRGSRHPKVSLETKDVAVAKERYEKQIGKPLADNRVARCNEAFEVFVQGARVEEGTRDRYRSLWNHYALWYLGSKRVSEVTPKDIIQVLNAATTSVRTGKPLSAQSRRHVYVMLSAFFRSCTEEPTRYRDDNPVSAIGKNYRPPTPESTAIAEEVVISDDEVDQIAQWIETRANHLRRDEHINALVHATVVQLMPYCGGRLGEVLGLTLTDWNRFARPYEELTIERQVNAKGKAGDPETWFKPLKGKKGTVGDEMRVIPLVPEIVAILEAYVTTGISEGWLAPGGLLFPSANGTPRSVGHVSTAIREAATQTLGRRYTSHMFRHTFASRILEQGGHIGEISELLGNSEDVCRKRYAHRADRSAFNTRIVGLLEASRKGR